MEDSRDTNGMKNTITETLKKLSYKNISIDTTDGRNTIADEILNAQESFVKEWKSKNNFEE